jgi:hypothetical protein
MWNDDDGAIAKTGSIFLPFLGWICIMSCEVGALPSEALWLATFPVAEWIAERKFPAKIAAGSACPIVSLCPDVRDGA